MIFKKMGKRGVSPLFATILLILFSIALGTMVMGLGKGYIEELPAANEGEQVIICETLSINDSLKSLQAKHILGEITREEYLEQEKGLLR